MSLMRVYPNLTVDGEFDKLGELGFSGALNDRQYSALVAAGYSGALPDMMKSFFEAGGVYPEGEPIPGGTISPTSITVKEGVAFSQQFTASGGTGPYTWSIQSGTLPGGLTLSTDTISGTPTGVEGDPYSFTIRATDSTGDYIDQAISGTVQAAGPVIADSFSVDIYTGNGSTQTITNGLDLATDGGLVWIKERGGANSNILVDTVRGVGITLSSDSTLGEASDADTLTAFNSDGFDLGADVKVNNSSDTYVAWAFKEVEGFFDIVTYTGDGLAGHDINHSLGVVPGMVVVKRLDSRQWAVYHRGTAVDPETDHLELNDTNAAADAANRWNDTAPTDSQFTVGTEIDVNASGLDHVAYLFAHNPDNGIYCGSYTGTGSAGNAVNLGWEPQFVMIKRADGTGNWQIWDDQRVESTLPARLFPNLTSAEQGTAAFSFSATGFTMAGSASDTNASGGEYIFMAIKAE